MPKTAVALLSSCFPFATVLEAGPQTAVHRKVTVKTFGQKELWITPRNTLATLKVVL